MTPFNRLFAEHVGAAFAKQLAFAEFLGDRGWSVDIQQGTVQFGSDLQYPLQLLGTEAEGDASWLWAWANDASNLPAALLQSGRELRELGERENIRELRERSFPLTLADGHAIALIASGLQGNCCYYRGPYDGGALFFLVFDVPATIFAPVTATRAITVLTEVTAQFTSDNPALMAESFLSSQGFTLQKTPAGIAATRDADAIAITLDDWQRITQIEGSLKPSLPPEPRSWWQFWR